jgi:putative transposase
MEVFLDDEDRKTYLRFLAKYGGKHGVEILAYCLMSNHIHMVAVPSEIGSLSRTLADTHMRYAQHFNWKYSQTGHLWQGRFFSCVMDDQHTLATARYVERNPVRAGLVGRAWDYKWSSAAAHTGASDDTLLSSRWPSKRELMQWSELLTEAEDGIKLEGIRLNTRTGRPLGTEGFLDNIEGLLGKMVRPRKSGRPRKITPSKPQ